MPLPRRSRQVEQDARRGHPRSRTAARTVAAAVALTVLLPTGVAAANPGSTAVLTTQVVQEATLWSLSGKVVSPEGEAVEGVLVQLSDVVDGTGPGATWTSGDGTFLFAGLPPRASYHAQVYDSGSVYLGGYVESSAGEVRLTKDRSRAQVFSATTSIGDVRLEAPSAIRGTVLDSAGRVAAGVRVVASEPGGSASALVGDDGAFVIEGVSAHADHVLSITGQPGINTAQYLTLDAGVWTVQGDLARATPVRGGAPAVDVRLAVSPRIDGTLRDADGTAIDGLNVQLLKSGSGMWAGSDRSTAGGKFAIDGLELGAEFVVAIDAWGDPRYLGGYVRVGDDGTATVVPDIEDATPVTTGTLGLDVVVGRTAGFSGRLTGVGAGDEYTSFTVHSDTGAIVGWPGGVTSGWGLGVDGSYSLSASVPGTYRIGVNRQSGISRYAATYFSATKPQGVTSVAKASPVLLTAGEITPDVDVELRECASVSGRLTGWRPTSGMVTVYDDENPDVATRQASINPDGTYTVTGLLPGKYHVAVDYFADTEAGLWGKWFLGGGTVEPERTRLDVPRCAPVKGVNLKLPAPVLEVTEAPVVTGSAVVGSELTATAGTWTLAGAHEPSVPTNVRYQWLRDGKAVKGGKSATYVPVRADVGKHLSVRVTAELTGFRKGTVTSATTAPVVAVSPGG